MNLCSFHGITSIDKMDIVFIFAAILGWLGNTEARRSAPVGNCRFTTVYKMLAADCGEINLVSIPNITRKIEVLDASLNRIRILKNNSFHGFDYLRFLYLNDNSITIIEAGTFLPLEELEVLDLSLNAIRDLPPFMPSNLRKLYISNNPLMNVPLSSAASLQYLNLAESHLAVLPPLGELPQLQELNLSSNPLTNLTVAQIASLCHLETLTLPQELLDSKQYTASCTCHRLRTWTLQHSIFVHPLFNCSVQDESECVTNSTEEAAAFTACQTVYQQQSATHWGVMAGVVGLALVCAGVLALVWRRRWRQQQPLPVRTPDQEAAFRKRKLLEETPKSKF